MSESPRLPPAPDPLPSPVVDNHTHFDHSRSGEPLDVDAAIKAATAVNVTRMVQIGCDLPAARWTVAMLDRHPEVVGGVALHPTEAAQLGAQLDTDLDTAMAEIEALAAHPRIRVIGETGLDYHWTKPDDVTGVPGRAAQIESFRRHIQLAKRLGKVLQIHDRDAHHDVLQVLADEGAPERTVFHCFSGDAAMAKFCADQGWFVSFSGTVTFKNAQPLREALRAVPLDRVLVETDAPYLTPVPHRGQPNASYLMPHTVRCIAQVVGLELGAVCARLDTTSEELYGPW